MQRRELSNLFAESAALSLARVPVDVQGIDAGASIADVSTFRWVCWVCADGSNDGDGDGGGCCGCCGGGSGGGSGGAGCALSSVRGGCKSGCPA